MECVVIGLGRFGKSVARTLTNNGHRVLGIDSDEKKCLEITDEIFDTVVLDATDIKALREIEINKFDKVIVAIGGINIQHNILTSLALKEVGAKNIIAKAVSDAHQQILTKLEIDYIVQPEKDMGIKVANKIMRNKILDFIEINDKYRIEEFEINKQHLGIVDHTIHEINLRKRYRINIICLQRGEEIIIVDADTVIEAGDRIFIVGENVQLNKFEDKELVERG